MPDNAGNTLSAARAVNAAAGLQTFSDRVDPLDLNDYYRFTLSSSSSLSLTLTGLTADANLQLLNSSGAVLQTSSNTESTSEAINTVVSGNLAPGTYYIRVYAPGNSLGTDYTLTMNAQRGDAKHELFWRNYSNGNNSIAHLGGALNAIPHPVESTLPPVEPDFEAVGIADFNQDGVFDIVWRSTSTGNNGVWFMGESGGNYTIAATALLGSAPTNWRIQDVTDYNNDGRPDLIWQDTVNRTLGVWLLGGNNNMEILSGVILGNLVPSTSWAVEAARDFNQDGNPDLLLRDYATGNNQIWFMGGANNTAVLSFASLNSLPTTWAIQGVTDLNEDGRPDIYTRNFTTGENQVWFMGGVNNTVITSIAAIAPRSTHSAFIPFTRFGTIATPDNAGNTLTTALNIGNLRGTGSFEDRVDNSDANDYYRFSLDTRTNVSFSLLPNQGDLDIQLLNGAGNLLQSGSASGSAPDSINAILEPGIYYVRVYPYSGGGTYKLNLAAIALTPPQSVSVTASDTSAAETIPGQTPNPGQFTITRSGDTSTALTVNYSLSGTATNGTDYSNVANSVIIPVGQTSVTIPVTVIDDSLIEGNETVVLALLASNNYVLGNTTVSTVTITDNDFQPVQDGAGNTLATARDIGVLTSPQTFSDRVDSNDPSDYYRFSLTTPGNFSLTLNGLTDDADVVLYDSNGNFIASSATDGTVPETINRPLATGTYFIQVVPYGTATTNYNLTVSSSAIALPTVEISALTSATEDIPSPGRFILTRTGSTTDALTINYTLSGTATNGIDYNFLPNSIVIPAGQTSVTIIINVIDDILIEGTETVDLNLNPGTGYNLGENATGGIAIVDNDFPPPTINVTTTDASAAETSNGQTPNPGQFTISRTGNNEGAYVINYTLSGTAINGIDYNSLSNSIMIPLGQTSVTLPINVIDDTLLEGNETVILTLNAGTGYVLGSTTGIVTIADNDSALPSITLTTTDANAAETLSGQTPNPGQFTITRTGSTNTALTINYSLSGTATNGTDYSSVTNSIVIPVGQTSVTLPINVIDDTLVESNETVVLTLNSSTNYTLGSSTAGTVAIADNDSALPSITLTTTDANAAETLSGQTPNPGQFTITRTGGTNTALTINYSIGGTATNGTDYSALSNSIVIPVGQTSVTIPINVIDDALVESNETVVITLSTGTGYSLGTVTTGLVTIADNETATPDGAGNTLETARDVGFLTSPQTFSDRVDFNDTNDYYRFRVANPGTFNLTVNNFTADVDVQLYNASGTLLAGSFNSGITPESLNLLLAAGTYYVRVYPYSGGVTNYTLNLSLTEPTPSTVTLLTSDANAAETASGQATNPGEFTITRTGGDINTALAIAYTLIGTATNGSDYSLLNNSILIPVGQTSVTIPINIIDDSLFEGNETVVITLVAGSGYTLGSTTTGTVSISDNDQLNFTNFTVTDASGDATANTVFQSGALQLSYALPSSTSVNEVRVEAWKDNRLVTNLGNWTTTSANQVLINLNSLTDFVDGDYQLRAIAKTSTNQEIISPFQAMKVLSWNESIGTTFGSFTADTFNHSATPNQGRIFVGRGGTDTLNLTGVSRNSVANLNGISLANYNPLNSTTNQAIFRGTAFDFLTLTDGREIYFQGIEWLQFTDGSLTLQVLPTDPNFGKQWNLQVTDVGSAWRFTQGSDKVLLVSWDGGIGGPVGSITDIATARLRTDSRSASDEPEFDESGNRDGGHGHLAINGMVATANNGTGISGINWNSQVLVHDVYGQPGNASTKITLQQSITEAISLARQNGWKVIFQGGIQGDFWLSSSGGTQAQLEQLFQQNADIALFAIAAGNGGLDIDDTTNPDSDYFGGGVARLQTTHGNLMSVGALRPGSATNHWYQSNSGITQVNNLTNVTSVDLADYSNRGTSLTLVAPTDTPAMTRFNTLDYFGGTSAANPNMAAIASLVWSINPTLTATQLRQLLIDTAMDLGTSGKDNTFGYGLVNTDAAIRRAIALNRNPLLAQLYNGRSTFA
jgi:hypothetical protein